MECPAWYRQALKGLWAWTGVRSPVTAHSAAGRTLPGDLGCNSVAQSQRVELLLDLWVPGKW